MMNVGALRQIVRPLRPLLPPRVVLFAVLFAWFLYAAVDLRLVFLDRDVLFLWNLRYLTDFVGQPGSLLQWSDNLLVQMCYFGWPAAIAIAAVTWLLLVSTVGLMNALGHAKMRGGWLIPAILVATLFGGYEFPTPTIVGLAVAVTAANGWVRMPARRAWLRLVLFVAASTLVYYVTGKAYYCFAAVCVIHEALSERRWRSGTAFLLAAVGVKFAVDAVLARIDLASHNFYVLSVEKPEEALLGWRATALYLCFPVCALFVVLRGSASALMRASWRRPGKSPSQQQEEMGDENREHPGHWRSLAWPRLRFLVCWLGGTVLALSLAAAAGFHFLDRHHKVLLEIDFCTQHGLWDDVLAKAKSLPLADYSPFVNHDVNLALYHTDRLPYQMLSYPQTYLPMLDMKAVQEDVASFRRPFDLLLEVGRVNEAEHLALETLEIRPSGGFLKRLAMVKLIKDQPAAARVILNVLRDDLVWGRWAEEHLQRLAADPHLNDDEEVQRIRGLMLSVDDMHLFCGFLPNGEVIYNTKIWLLDLLERNGANQMAFEYLMLTCLSRGEVEAAAQLFSFLDRMPYPTTPPIYEEAAMLYLTMHPDEMRQVGSAIFFRGRQISDATVKRFGRFQEIAAQCDGVKQKMAAAMPRELADTYFFYYYFLAPRTQQ
ncbi:MAG: DUF6057 family protein [Thermoguttaceae bacterium]|jgi:hypothetical protein